MSAGASACRRLRCVEMVKQRGIYADSQCIALSFRELIQAATAKSIHIDALVPADDLDWPEISYLK